MGNKFFFKRGTSLTDRFLGSYKIVESGCWEWQKTINFQGYGIFKARGGKRILAHRFSYELFIGELANTKELVCHKCDNRKCVNPFHFFKGSHKDNSNDAQLKGRIHVATCPSIGRYKQGCRCDGCKAVKNNMSRKSKAKNREKVLRNAAEYARKKTATLKLNPVIYRQILDMNNTKTKNRRKLLKETDPIKYREWLTKQSARKKYNRHIRKSLMD